MFDWLLRLSACIRCAEIVAATKTAYPAGILLVERRFNGAIKRLRGRNLQPSASEAVKGFAASMNVTSFGHTWVTIVNDRNDVIAWFKVQVPASPVRAADRAHNRGPTAASEGREKQSDGTLAVRMDVPGTHRRRSRLFHRLGRQADGIPSDALQPSGRDRQPGEVRATVQERPVHELRKLDFSRSR